MVWTERILPNGEGALEERLGLGVAALVLVHLGQVAERRRDIGVVWTERLLPNGEGTLEERLGLGVAALDSVQFG